MVVADDIMDRPTLKISVSDSESSGSEESQESEDDVKVNASGEDAENISGEEDADNISGEEDSENIEADADSDDSQDSGGESDNSLLVTNEGWADAVAKVLGSTKPKNKKTLVLSRAKKFTETVKENEEKPQFEVIGDDKDIKPVVKKEEPSEAGSTENAVKKKKIDKPSIRIKPNILEKDRERLLNKIATKGVVQLFNAVRNQQKNLEKDINDEYTESKKEKVLKKFDKRTFLDTLMGSTKSVIVDDAKKMKKEEVKEEAPKWSALRDDFMMGAKMKDWDKESVDE